MKLADFPLFSTALQKDPRRSAWVEEALASLTEGMENGAIANQNFVSAKDVVNRAFERAWEVYADRHGQNSPLNIYRRNENHTAPENEKVKQFIWGFYHPTAHLNAGQIKKIKAFPSDPAWAIILPFLEEIAPICDAITFLKDKVVKRQPKSEEEKRAIKFTPPPATTAAAKQVAALLEEVVTASFDQLVAFNEKSYLGKLAQFEKAQKAAAGDKTKNEPNGLNRRTGELEYSEYYSLRWHFTINKDDALVNVAENLGYRNRKKITVDAVGVALLSRVVRAGRVGGDRFSGEYTEIVAPNAVEILKEQAFKDADELRQMFIVKNLKKIVSVVEGKGDGQMTESRVVNTEVSLQSLEGELYFAFADGSSFRVKNAVVGAISVLGNPFLRFPLTFHDAKMPGGAKMPLPSEERMNTIFLGKTKA